MERKPTVSISNQVNEILVKFSRSEGVTKSKAVQLLINNDAVKVYYKNQYNLRRHQRRKASRQKKPLQLVNKSMLAD